MTKVLVVDGMSILKTIAGPMASFTNGYSFNFFQSLTSTIRKVGPISSVYVCWEGGHEHRLRVFPDYKKDRPKTSKDIVRVQREEFVKPLLAATGCVQASAVGFEGDDIGAQIARTYAEQGQEVVLYTNDTDWIQLVGPRVSIYQKFEWDGKKTERMLVTKDNFFKITGFRDGATYLRAKAIYGDGSDSIPGVYGVGPSVVKSFLNSGEVSPTKRQSIEDFIASEDYARNLALINLISPAERPELSLVHPAKSKETALRLVTEYGWRSVLAKFPAWWECYEGLI